MAGTDAQRSGVVLVIGDANADLCAPVERFPREGDDSPLRGLAWGSGGAGANVATALARLGARARLLARVGSDPAAEVALRAAREAGVELAAVQRDEALATGLCFAAVSPGGERTFFSYRGANAALAAPDAGVVWSEVAWVHVGGHALLEGRQREVTLDLIAEARRSGVPISLDLCLPLLHARPEALREVGPLAAVVFANERELEVITAGAGARAIGGDSLETAIDAIARAGAPLVAAKLGARGSLVAGPALERRALPAWPVEACDTTACGDAYVAAFLFALLRGASPEAAGRIAGAAGAITATRPGAAEALPSRAELLDFLAARGAADELPRLLAAAERDPL